MSGAATPGGTAEPVTLVAAANGWWIECKAMDPHALAEARSLALRRAVWARIAAEPGSLAAVRARLVA